MFRKSKETSICPPHRYPRGSGTSSPASSPTPYSLQRCTEHGAFLQKHTILFALSRGFLSPIAPKSPQTSWMASSTFLAFRLGTVSVELQGALMPLKQSQSSPWGPVHLTRPLHSPRFCLPLHFLCAPVIGGSQPTDPEPHRLQLHPWLLWDNLSVSCEAVSLSRCPPIGFIKS